jgi:hypothetical protein
VGEELLHLSKFPTDWPQKASESPPAEERAQRRRRLTRGPPEFREDRVDLAEAESNKGGSNSVQKAED